MPGVGSAPVGPQPASAPPGKGMILACRTAWPACQYQTGRHKDDACSTIITGRTQRLQHGGPTGRAPPLSSWNATPINAPYLPHSPIHAATRHCIPFPCSVFAVQLHPSCYRDSTTNRVYNAAFHTLLKAPTAFPCPTPRAQANQPQPQQQPPSLPYGNPHSQPPSPGPRGPMPGRLVLQRQALAAWRLRIRRRCSCCPQEA